MRAGYGNKITYKIKHGAYDVGNHCIALYVYNDDVTYFDSFGVEHIPKKSKTFISNNKIKTNIFRIQAYD